MRAIKIIFRRELGAYFRSPFSWVLACVFLLMSGILFQTFGLGLKDKPLSAFVLERYFYTGFGIAIAGGILLSFRLISEERQNHSLVLLSTSPVRDSEIVLGKFFAALAFLAFLLALSLYIPLMIKIGNKITFAQILVGYLGMLLAGAVALAVGLFASSLSRYMLVSGVIAFAIVLVMCFLYQFAKNALEGTPQQVFGELDMFWIHYQQGFMRGVLKLKDVIYYLAVTYFFLLLTIKTMEAKRWQ